MMNQDLITYDEAAAILNVVNQTVRTIVARGNLHPVKLPGKREKYLHRADVLRYRDGASAPAPAQTSAANAAPDTSDETAARVAIADKIVQTYTTVNESLQETCTKMSADHAAIAASFASAASALAASLRDAAVALISNGNAEQEQFAQFFNTIMAALTGPDGQPSNQQAGEVMKRALVAVMGREGPAERKFGATIAHAFDGYDQSFVQGRPASASA